MTWTALHPNVSALCDMRRRGHVLVVREGETFVASLVRGGERCAAKEEAFVSEGEAKKWAERQARRLGLVPPTRRRA